MLFAGMLADRWAARHPGGRMLVQATGLLCGIVFVTTVGLTRDVAILLVALTCFGLCNGFFDSNTFASLFDVIEPHARASAKGLMNMVGWGGGALGPLAVGLATRFRRHSSEVENSSEAIAFGGVVHLVGAGLILWAALRCVRHDAIASPCRAAVVPCH